MKFNKILNIPKSAVEFRNKVIHQGYFPNYDETKDYAIKIYEIIIEVLSELFKLREEFNNILISKRLDEYKNYNGNNQGIEFNGYISFIDIFTLEKTLNDNFENKFKEFYKDNILEVPFG